LQEDLYSAAVYKTVKRKRALRSLF
jgi:hypothetical protein